MKCAIFFITVFLLQDLPLKPKEDFEIKLDYQFKQRPDLENSSIHFGETQKEKDRRTSGAMLPYLVIKINLLKVPAEEVRARITNNMNQVSSNKKIGIGSSIPLDLGFTDDIKDRVAAHDYKITFVSSERKELSQISIFIEEDGTFLVNGEKRGKF